MRVLITALHHSKINFDQSEQRPGLLDVVSVLVAHSELAPYYKGWTAMCLWYAGSTTDIIMAMHGGREEIVNAKLWEFGGKVKILSVRKAIYKPYESTTKELQAAVGEVEGVVKGKDQRAALDPAVTEEVVSNLKSLSKERLVERATALKNEKEEMLRSSG